MKILVLLPVLLVGELLTSAADAASGAWVAPLDVVTVRRGFDPPQQRWEPGHRGVDLAGSVGDAVRAAGDGDVVFAGELAGRGVVSVRHGELRTTYEPVEAVVEVGDRVSRGAVVGRLRPGHAGSGPVLDHALLHWGLRRGDTYLDPMSLLGSARVRLLPRWEPPAVPDERSPPRVGGAGLIDRRASRSSPTARRAVGVAAVAALSVLGALAGRRQR